MRYAQIRELDISNGDGLGVALFVQGCRFKCFNCFNMETWDFLGGKEWNKSTEELFLSLINREYITRISILGGEPLEKENVKCVSALILKIKAIFPSKKIWLYTGYSIEELLKDIKFPLAENWEEETVRRNILESVDILIDGKYIDALKDTSLKWRGSSNQRVIDMKKTLANGEVILYEI